MTMTPSSGTSTVGTQTRRASTAQQGLLRPKQSRLRLSDPERGRVMAWATPHDVRDRWLGPGSIPASDEQLATLIGDAEDTILRAFPDIQQRIDNNDLPLPRVVKVVCRMVIRHIRNPEGVRSTQQGAGPFQVTRTFGGDEPGALYLSDQDMAELAPGRRGRAFTIDTTPVHS